MQNKYNKTGNDCVTTNDLSINDVTNANNAKSMTSSQTQAITYASII